jgi:hypothetical protein
MDNFSGHSSILECTDYPSDHHKAQHHRIMSRFFEHRDITDPLPPFPPVQTSVFEIASVNHAKMTRLQFVVHFTISQGKGSEKHVSSSHSAAE